MIIQDEFKRCSRDAAWMCEAYRLNKREIELSNGSSIKAQAAITAGHGQQSLWLAW